MHFRSLSKINRLLSRLIKREGKGKRVRKKTQLKNIELGVIGSLEKIKPFFPSPEMNNRLKIQRDLLNPVSKKKASEYKINF